MSLLWNELTEPQQAVIRRVLSRFHHGEAQVEFQLQPLIDKRLREGRYAEAKYVSIFQEEEKKHGEFFARYFREVIGHDSLGVKDPYSAPFRRLFNDTLEFELSRLNRNNWRAEVHALTTYMLVCEGTIAETAYFGFGQALILPNKHELLPGLLEGLRYIKLDESRHIRYGERALRRLVEEHGELAAIEVIAQLLRVSRDTFGSVGMVHREFEPFPFPSLDRGKLLAYAVDQFSARLHSILQGTYTYSAVEAVRQTVKSAAKISQSLNS